MKAVLLGSEPMENKPEETLLIPHEKLSIFYEWLENHDKQVRVKAVDEFIDKFLGQTQLRQMTKSECVSKMYDIACEIKEQNNGIW